MTSNKAPSGKPASGGLPPTRRSTRQQQSQRSSGRSTGRSGALDSAGTRGGRGRSNLIVYSAVAIVAALVIVGAAVFLTSSNSVSSGPGYSPAAPQASFITPTNVPMSGRTLGNANAKHTIDVWEDFQCPNCREFTLSVEPQLVNDFVAKGDVKLVFHDFLVIDSNTGGHESLDAANAARCAADQGKFWQYHDWLYTNQYGEGSGAFTKDRLKEMGAMMAQTMTGFDTNKFDSCVDNGTHDSEVKAESASPPSGNSGTPTIVIDGKLQANWDYDTIAAALDTALGISPSPTASASGSASASASSSASASASAVASATPTATPTAAPTPSPTPTASPTK